MHYILIWEYDHVFFRAAVLSIRYYPEFIRFLTLSVIYFYKLYKVGKLHKTISDITEQ